MSRHLKYVYPATDAVALSQSAAVAAGGNVILNGTLANNITHTVDFISYGYSRTVTITSAANINARIFTITGTQNGLVITDTITGVNANTVASLKTFDTVTSIVLTTGAGATVSAGTGLRGYFRIIAINTEVPIVNYSLSLAATAHANQISTVVYSSIDLIVNDPFNLITNNGTYDVMLAAQAAGGSFKFFTVKAVSAEDLYSVQYPETSLLSLVTPQAVPAVPLMTRYLLVLLGSDANAASATNSTTLIYTQL